MRTGVDRIRIWLVVGATLLVLVVGGFLGFARYRSRRFLAGLPGRLGANISRQAEGYTWSQSGSDGRAIFTMHAAKLEQRNDGKVLLHDVGIVLYGRKQDRADRVYGNEFEYDQAAEIIRAIGEVHMDLEAPAPADSATKKQKPVSVTEGEPASDANIIHVKHQRVSVYLNRSEVNCGYDLTRRWSSRYAGLQMTWQAQGARSSTPIRERACPAVKCAHEWPDFDRADGDDGEPRGAAQAGAGG